MTMEKSERFQGHKNEELITMQRLAPIFIDLLTLFERIRRNICAFILSM